MKNNTIALEGSTKQYRKELIQRVEWAVHASGSWIVDLATSSSKDIMLQIETKTDRLGTLYDCLKASQLSLGLADEAAKAIKEIAAQQESSDGVVVNLNVRFESSTPESLLFV